MYLPDWWELPALRLHEVQGVCHNPVLGRVPERCPPRLKQLKNLNED